MKVHAFRCVRTSICIMPSWSSFVVVFDLVSPPWTRKKNSLSLLSITISFKIRARFYTLKKKGDTITIKSSFPRKLHQAKKKCSTIQYSSRVAKLNFQISENPSCLFKKIIPKEKEKFERRMQKVFKGTKSSREAEQKVG